MLVSAVLACAWTAFPQAPSLVPLHVPGIGDAVVTCFAQDGTGALWLGTDRGLVRFDGSATEHFVRDPVDHDALPYDLVYDVLIRGEELWAATPTGVLRMNVRTSERHAVRYAYGDAPARHRETFTLTASRRGVWGFAGDAAYLCAIGDSVFRRITSDAPPPMRAAGGWEAPDGTLWYCDRMAMRHFDPVSGHEAVFPCEPFGEEAPPKTLLLDVLPDRYDAKVLWCRSWGLGLVRFDTRDGTFAPLVETRTLNDLTNIVQAAVQLGPDRWLLNGNGRLLVLEQERFTAVGPMAPVGGLMRNADGDVFVGGLGSVQVVRQAAQGMRMLPGEGAQANAHPIAAHDGNGTWSTHFYHDRRLVRVDSNGHVMYTYHFPEEGMPYEAFLLVEAMHGPRPGTVWVGSTRGLYRLSPGDEGPVGVPVRAPGLTGDMPMISALGESDDGAIWAGIGTQGVHRIDPVTGRGRQVIPASDSDHFIDLGRLDRDHMVAVCRRGAPWIIDVRNGSAERMAVDGAGPARFVGIEGAAVDADGAVLLFTAGLGLVRLEQRGKRWTLARTWYLNERPVFADGVYDGRGRAWLTSDRGAYLLDHGSGRLHALDALHGVKGLFGGFAEATPRGDVLLNGDGLVRFDTTFEPLADRARLVLRSLEVNGAQRMPAWSQEGSLTLSPAERDLTATFSTIALFAGNVFIYAYMLDRDEGAEQWVELGAQRSLNLLGLSPGEHELRLRATSVRTGTVEARLHLTVLPAWWRTWWALALFTVLGVALVVAATRQVLAVRYRRRLRELEREREVERVRMRIARDIHDGIGSGLTKITMMTRQLTRDPQQADRIARASTELVNELGEIVWTVDPRNDSFGSFIAYVRSTLGRQFEHLEVELRTDLHCDPLDRDRIIGPELKRNLLLTMKEAVNNALKHGQAGRIEVHLTLSTTQVELRVVDNGIGFDPANVREGANGLANFRKRAEAVHGRLEIRSGSGGTTIALSAPISPTNM